MRIKPSYQPKRRHIFPAILLCTAMVGSAFTAKLNAPQTNYDYLDEIRVQHADASTTNWVENTDLPHRDKLTDKDILSFKKLAEGLTLNIERDVYIGQAKQYIQSKDCPVENKICTIKAHLNRNITPTYIHGDLRLVSLTETSLVQELETTVETVEHIASYIQSRQLRFMLTDYGWVQTTSEELETAEFEPELSQKLPTTQYSGLNYYPKSAPWDEFWPEYPRDEIMKDLSYIKSIGANSLRIFVNHAYFTHTETAQLGQDKLVDFLNLSAENDLKVIVTLFDLRGDYRFRNWSSDAAHLSEIIGLIGEHEALLAIDIKNEADLDFESAGEDQVQAWLSAMIDSARYSNIDVPLTIGWSDPVHAIRLSHDLDIISYHDYQPVKGIGERFTEVKGKIGHKPVFLTEIGSSRWGVFGEKPQRQGAWLETQLAQLDDADGVMIWTLHDFDEVGSNIVGHRPWRQSQQKQYGIIDNDMSLLPAGLAFKNFNSQRK